MSIWRASLRLLCSADLFVIDCLAEDWQCYSVSTMDPEIGMLLLT
jgi:hypothetical protein